ncbi:MAG: hypothetical protein V3575_07005, partial [Candidatus Absconditabacteria bacterium]
FFCRMPLMIDNIIFLYYYYAMKLKTLLNFPNLKNKFYTCFFASPVEKEIFFINLVKEYQNSVIFLKSHFSSSFDLNDLKSVTKLSKKLIHKLVIVELFNANDLELFFDSDKLGCPVIIVLAEQTNNQNNNIPFFSAHLSELTKEKATLKTVSKITIFKLLRFYKNAYPILLIGYIVLGISLYGLGANTISSLNDSNYRYVSNQIEKSNYSNGHSVYLSGLGFEDATYGHLMLADYKNTILSMPYNFQPQSINVHPTYVPAYLRYIPSRDSTILSSSISVNGIQYTTNVLGINNVGYSSPDAEIDSKYYGMFIDISLKRFKYIERDWSDDTGESRQFIYIDSHQADNIINDNVDKYASYEDLIQLSVTIQIGTLIIDGFIANVIKSDQGHAPILSNIYESYSLTKFPTALLKAMEYEFCFDPSTSYFNTRTIIDEVISKKWETGDTLTYYTLSENNLIQILPNLSNEFSYFASKGYFFDKNNSLIWSISSLFSFLFLVYVNGKVIKKQHDIKDNSFFHFGFMALPLISLLLIQFPLYVFMSVSKHSLLSFQCFNSQGSFYNLLLLFVYLLIINLFLMINSRKGEISENTLTKLK